MNHPFPVLTKVQVIENPQDRPEGLATRGHLSPFVGEVWDWSPVHGGGYRYVVGIAAAEWNRYAGRKTDRAESLHCYSHELQPVGGES